MGAYDWDREDRRGVRSFKIDVLRDTEYPSYLPSLVTGVQLYAIGNHELLRRLCIGVCGSRSASASALRWAHEFGLQAAHQGLVVVSGYARGVDREAHKGTLEAGGSTIAVLAEGIRHFRIPTELKPFVDLERNFLALSMFDPDAPWKVWRAMERNKLIVGLSIGLFVIEARERGGTINAAYESIRQGKRLWAVAYSDGGPNREGNRKLLASKAIPLTHVNDLKPALERAMASPPPEVRQLVLNVTGPERE